MLSYKKISFPNWCQNLIILTDLAGQDLTLQALSSFLALAEGSQNSCQGMMIRRGRRGYLGISNLMDRLSRRGVSTEGTPDLLTSSTGG